MGNANRRTIPSRNHPPTAKRKSICFGAIYADYTAPSWLPGPVRNILAWADPQFTYDIKCVPCCYLPYYLSFVTMTTLGVASVDIANPAAFWWHTAQNIIGFLLLGYLVAVIGSKFTRRSA